MSVRDSRLILITENDFNLLSSAKGELVFQIKDLPGTPEYRYDGEKFISYISQNYGNTIITFPDLKIGAGNNYVEFEQDGTLVNKGDATTWIDIDFPIIIRTTGTHIPSLVAVQGNITAPQWQVDDFNVCEGHEMIHSWKEGSAIDWHCHIITNGVDVNDRYIKWEIEWFWADINNVISSTITTISPDFLIPANTPSHTHLLCPIEEIVFPAKIIAHIWARLKRVTATGTSPSNNPWCTMLQIHIENDTLGSRLETTK